MNTKKKVDECGDCGAVTVLSPEGMNGFSILNNTTGLDPLSPPNGVAFDGNSQLSSNIGVGCDCIYNGFDKPRKRKKYYVARKRKKRLRKVRENLSYEDAKLLAESLNRICMSNEIEFKIYEMV